MSQIASLVGSLSASSPLARNPFTAGGSTPGAAGLSNADQSELSPELADELNESGQSGQPKALLSMLDTMKSKSKSPSHETSSTPKTHKTSTDDIKNPTDFAKSLLQGLHAPDTKANVNSLVNWEHREGGNWKNDAHFNPLNTTKDEPGATDINSDGVKSYKNWNQGVQATVKTLENGAYGDIVSALRSGHGLIGNFKGLSTWSGGAYSSV